MQMGAAGTTRCRQWNKQGRQYPDLLGLVNRASVGIGAHKELTMHKLWFTFTVFLVLATIGSYAVDAKKKLMNNKYGDGDFEFIDELGFESNRTIAGTARWMDGKDYGLSQLQFYPAHRDRAAFVKSCRRTSSTDAFLMISSYVTSRLAGALVAVATRVHHISHTSGPEQGTQKAYKWFN
uniref:Uncharacterized protein n=1 Tax=Anopheles farauti TaxID=69004 RepID=A0A182QN84_9DIPT